MNVAPILRVRYQETDQMGVVYHGNYLSYFEVGRTELMRHLGFPYAEMERQGFLLAVVETCCKYLAAACYDDVLRIETGGEVRSALRVRFTSRVVRERDGVVVAEGWVELACLDRERRPRRLPEAVRRKFEEIQATTDRPIVGRRSAPPST
ncbi:MAG: acyl-CoA thioesterase [Planctomycetes bacterium]|nr:acyl-CoA thioesterase [Planctomycetota bacterium]